MSDDEQLKNIVGYQIDQVGKLKTMTVGNGSSETTGIGYEDVYQAALKQYGKGQLLTSTPWGNQQTILRYATNRDDIYLEITTDDRTGKDTGRQLIRLGKSANQAFKEELRG